MTPRFIETLYSKGTAADHEDGLVINPPFFGIIDGYSAPYSPKNPKMLFQGLSGGEMVRKEIQCFFSAAQPNATLERVLLNANEAIYDVCREHDLDTRDAGLLPGASFVFIKLSPKSTEIIQGGDCLATWLLPTSSAIYATKNQAFLHVMDNLSTIQELLKKHSGDRAKMWDEFLPILVERRRQDINKSRLRGFASLNGQIGVRPCWYRVHIPTSNLDSIIMFSDGLVKYEQTGNMEVFAEQLVSQYYRFGLRGILYEKRNFEEILSSYTSHEEATGMALAFSD